MKRTLVLTTTAMLLGAACTTTGSDAAPDASATPIDTTSANPPAASTPGPTVAPADAVVRVVTTGTFVSPDFGQMDTVAGSGSAFIIDQSGLAVTNNHVVAGAASVEVFFDGSDQPVAATVIANSECSDLAVIDLAGDGYAALSWSQEETSPGLSIRAAGYPGGDPGLTLTGGIIARIDDDGATPWASIESLVRHDADLAPGNSGGPIVDEAGNIVGVNVAASDAGRFAIPTSVARPIVDDLQAGIDVDSIGLNAVAVLDEITNESGVWVVSVEAGSPAAAAGVQPGDVITRMKGVRVGQDATLADYCAVVRSGGTGELPIEVTRGAGFLAGSVRGTGLVPVLVVTGQAVDTATEPPPAISGPPPAGTPYEAFDTVTDDSGIVSFDLPTDWADRRTGPVFIGGADRPSIAAGFDVEALDAAAGTTYDEAGIAAVVFSADVDIEDGFAVVTDNAPWMSDCIALERQVVIDSVYESVVQPFMDCAGTQSMVFSFATRRLTDPNWLLVNIFARNIADLDAAVRIAETFEFGQVPNNASPAVDQETATDGANDADAEGDSVESEVTVSDLPETLSNIDSILAAIGTPPQIGSPTTTQSDGMTMITYTTTASPDEIHAWIDDRIDAVGCQDRFSSKSGDNGSSFYSVSCDLFDDSQFLSYVLRLYASPGDTQVEIAVFDLTS